VKNVGCILFNFVGRMARLVIVHRNGRILEMKCPNCKNELEFHAPVIFNVEAYGGPVTGLTSCCETMLSVERVVSFRFSESDAQEDDWGNA
jgi:hypothetical protein